ncbi:MAG: excinuclease ABC subunit UvrC [SAR202 cluster bacterium]|nr:excinuclease ABC subunit UvrC [SAR202 cluster bacterium]
MAGYRFAERLRITPGRPGVYIMKDAQGKVLYVGKAANLQNRLRSYFHSSTHEPKITRMVSRLADFEFIVVDSAAEALILENTLIKRHKPPFNARLKDDKTYPYIKIDRKEDFPQIYVTRRVENDGSICFGPFATAHSIRKTLDLLKKLFPYRSCTKVITGKDPRPCLEYFINRCSGPCIGAINKEDYHKIIDQVILFMEGKTESVMTDLKQKMSDHSDRLEFERAAALRDQLKAIERVVEEQRIKTGSVGGDDMDVVGLAQRDNQASVQVFFIRNGRLTGHENFVMDGTQDEPPERVIARFLQQYYLSATYVPRRILLQSASEEAEDIQSWLRQKRQGAVSLEVPQRGDNRKLVQMASENAQQHLNQLRVKWWSNADALQEAVTELQEALDLSGPPRRIECYDISNIQGTNSVGSMVVFEDGAPKPAQYRRFKIKSVPGVDDYSMMQEMLRRRFKRLSEMRGKAKDKAPDGEYFEDKDGRWGVEPHLVLIDGGKGHLSAALEVFLELGLDFIPLASIAKENEEIFLPHTPEPIILPKSSAALHLVQRVRDEAHRFAITYHRKLRSRGSLKSSIDLVTGIGPKRKKMLLRRFGSLKGIKDAPVEDIAAVPGMTQSLALRLKQTL